MEYYVPSSILFQTTKCIQSFSCLRTQNRECPGGCEVLQGVGETFLTLKKKKDKPSCPYRTTVLDVQLCTCPTHNALYKQLQQQNKPMSSMKETPTVRGL